MKGLCESFEIDLPANMGILVLEIFRKLSFCHTAVKVRNQIYIFSIATADSLNGAILE